MARLLHYISGADTLSAERAREVGLGHIVDAGGGMKTCAVVRGPDGERGIVVSRSDQTGGAVGYYADLQTWRPVEQSAMRTQWRPCGARLKLQRAAPREAIRSLVYRCADRSC